MHAIGILDPRRPEHVTAWVRSTSQGCRAFELCEEYDQNCVDPAYDTLPLDAFAPLVRKVFAAPEKSIFLEPAA